MKLILAALFSITLTINGFSQQTTLEPDFRQAAEKLTALLYHIEKSYVDSVSTTELVDGAIRKMLEDLDPHSVYIPAEDVARANEGLEGNFEGIGIQYSERHHNCRISYCWWTQRITRDYGR